MSDDTRSDWERVVSRAASFQRQGWKIIEEQREPPRIRLRTMTGTPRSLVGRGLEVPRERRPRPVCRDVYIGDDGRVAWENVPCGEADTDEG